MPLLLYCVTSQSDIDAPADQGLGEVRAIDDAKHGLRCYYSHVNTLGSDAEEAKSAALAFYGVNETLFRRVAIIPFRFPTVLADEGAIAQELARNGAQFRAALERVADAVQGEVNLRVLPQGSGTKTGSGAEYLRSLSARGKSLDEAAARIRAAAGELVRQWQQRRLGDAVRLYALVARKDYVAFVEKPGTAGLPCGIECRLSGPWPATEFLGLKLESGAGSGFPPNEVK
jgi:hypothetical protein